MSRRVPLDVVLPLAAGLLLVGLLVQIVAGRLYYPFDLEWMEGGMVAHAWRLSQGLPLYIRPTPEFAPFIYPPGYSAVVAALGEGLQLGPPLGRGVSVVGTLMAAAALAFGVRGEGGSGTVAAVSACVFLGTYPDVGAFFDLARPDGLAVALLAWAIVVGARERPGAPAAAGLLLCAAFLAKHNMAAFGIPMVLGLARRGWRPAASFVVASVVPALLMIGLLQWRSGGLFLTYLLEVPQAHVMYWDRARIDMVRELGSALPLPVAVVGLWFVWGAVTGQRRVPVQAAAIGPVWLGMAVAWAGTYFAPAPGSALLNVPSGVAYWALAASAVAVPLQLLGGWPSFKATYGAGILGCAVGMSMVMRSHDGGFVNVHIPLFWTVSLASGIVLARWAAVPSRALRSVVVAVLVLQPLYAASRLDPEALVPGRADVAAGMRFVRAMRAVDGPVLSPFASWMPVYAGRPPSIHAMAVWDCNYQGGPFQDDLTTISAALRDREYVMILGGTHRFLGKLTDYYDVGEVILEGSNEALMPRTGWRSRPWRILYPKESYD